MRLRSTIFDQRAYQAAPSAGEEPQRGEAGAEGDAWYQLIQGGGPDINPELSGSAKFDVFDEMALTDPTIKSLLLFHALPTRSAVWSLDPSDENDGVSRLIRDAAAWNFGLEGELGELDVSWSNLIGTIAKTALTHGPFVGEILWDTDGRTWRDADGDEHDLWPVAALSSRHPRTIEHVNRKMGRLVNITQNVPGTKPMPADKVVYVVPEPKANHWEGDSMIRPAWAAWVAKKALQIAAGIGWDRFSSGIPVIWHPDDPDAEERAKRIGKAVRQHQRAYVNLPSSGPSIGGQGRPNSEWFIDLLNGSAALSDPTPLLRWLCDQEIEAGLAHFAGLGRTESGSRALGEVQIDPFFLAVQALADLVRRDLSRQLLRRFVQVNFGLEAAMTMTPKLTVSKIQARNVEVIARALSYLSPLGFRLTDAGATNDLRELLGFAPLPEEAAEALGIRREELIGILRSIGLDEATFAAIIQALPPELGVARNGDRPELEGAGLNV